jgi:hypothetical protein
MNRFPTEPPRAYTALELHAFGITSGHETSSEYTTCGKEWGEHRCNRTPGHAVIIDRLRRIDHWCSCGADSGATDK